MGGGGPGGGMGGGPGGGERVRRESDGPKSGTVYLVEKETLPAGGERVVLKAVPVKLGIGDATNVEVLEGLKEGDLVATGTAAATAAASNAPRNPFGSPFGGPPRGR